MMSGKQDASAILSTGKRTEGRGTEGQNFACKYLLEVYFIVQEGET
jgi:hypothetical protein